MADNDTAPGVVTLKEYVEVRIASLEKATTLAANNMERRLEGMNEFRAQLTAQNNTFYTKAEQGEYAAGVQKEIQSLRESRATGEGKATQASVNIAYALTAISIIIGVVSLILKITGN